MTKTVGKDLDAFLASHDRSYIVPKKIEAGLKTLGDSWLYEADMVRHCGVSQADFAMFRDQFKEFYVETKVVGSGSRGARERRVWAGTKAFAAKLRSAVR